MASEATLASKIVFYADNCVSGDQIVGYTVDFGAHVYRRSGRAAATNKNEECRQKFGHTHHEVWDSVATLLKQELASLIGFTGNLSELCHLAILPVETCCR
jgi:hypothetical protein